MSRKVKEVETMNNETMNNETMNNEVITDSVMSTEEVAKLDTNLLRVTTNMAKALAFNEDDAYTEIARKDGTTVEIVKQVFEFKEPIGNRNQLTIMDMDIIKSVKTIQGAINVRKMSNYIICKEFSRINESGKLENMGFKTIGEFGKALFGLETSTVNHYARIGTLFITDDYEVNPLLPQLSVSHLLELESYENGDVEKISELFQNGTLSDGMSTKKIREVLKSLSENAIEDKESSNENSNDNSTSDTDSNSNVSTTDNSSSNSDNASQSSSAEPTAESVEQLSASFDKQIVVGKMLNYCEVIEQLFGLLKEHDIEVVDYNTPIDAIKAMVQALL